MTLHTPFIHRITSPAYYCEVDAYAAEFLRNLVAAGQIAPGDVDERSIEDVTPDDLRGYAQCHFFAGVGVWSYAARLAGFPDDRPLWTGSCPCQPFSAAGKGAGVDDVRHLWPAWHWLIEQCRPETVFGEQVASKDGLGWFDLVAADMEATGYAIGAVDTCAAGFGGFHIRQRLYFAGTDDRVANAVGSEWRPCVDGSGDPDGQAGQRIEGPDRSGECRDHRGLAHTVGQHGRLAKGCGGEQVSENLGGGKAGRVGDAFGPRSPIGLSETLGGCEGHADVTDDRSGGLSGQESWQSETSRMDNAGSVGRDAGRDRDHGRDERIKSDPTISDGRMAHATHIGCDGGSRLSDSDTRGGGYQPADRSIGRRMAHFDSNPSPEHGEQSRLSARRQTTTLNASITTGGRKDLRARSFDVGRQAADWLFCRDGKWRPVEPGTFPLAHEATARVGRLRAYGNGLDAGQAAAFIAAFLSRDRANLSAAPAGDLFEWGVA